MNWKNLLCVLSGIAPILVFGAFIGVQIDRVVYPRPTIEHSVMWEYIYHSTVDGKLAIEIKPDGSSNIGPAYDRMTEAKKLFEMVKRWKDSDAVLDCHETSYHSPYWSTPDNGVMQARPGRGEPPPSLGLKFGKVK